MPVVAVLLVEDSDADATTILELLEREGLDCVVERARNLAGFRSAISRKSADIILADTSLPDGDAFVMLAEAKARAPESAFIFVSSGEGEEKAVEALKAGAADYVLKHRLERLGPAVKLALAEARERSERRRYEEEVKRLNDALARRVRELQALIEIAPVGIAFAQDEEGREVTVNAALAALLGVRRSAAQFDAGQWGRLACRFVRGQNVISSADLPIHRAARQGSVIEGEELQIERSDGRRLAIAASASPVHDENGRVLGAVSVWVDITERKRAEAERERLLESERVARSEAERTSQLKDEFLSTLSHELRTPLNSIVGWTHILRHAQLDEERRREGLQVIERNARAQTSLIEDLLDMSRILSGQVRLVGTHVDLSDVIAHAVESLRPTADAKGIRIESSGPPRPAHITGDAARLQQVVTNLLSNAIKFTPDGGKVRVVLARTDRDVELSVIDTGEGIATHFLPFVFESFRQADASITRKHGGLGLGLAIVKHLVELHGGRVRAQSAGEGQGAAFIVTLPALAVPTATEMGIKRAVACTRSANPQFETQVLRGLRVLCVDDDPEGLELLRLLLGARGAVVRLAPSVPAALACLGAFQPDVLVSDIGMPGEDGYQLIRRIRCDLGLPSEDLPAIALTAFARSEDAARALAAGFDRHLPKPVDVNELLASVAQLGSVRRERQHGC